MIEIIIDFSNSILFELFQLLAGLLFSAALYKLIPAVEEEKEGSIHKLMWIGAASLLGMLLPLNIYGVAPIFIVLLFKGHRLYKVIPIVISNALFNLLLPLSDISFILDRSIDVLILAFFSGFIAGILTEQLNKKDIYLRLRNISSCIKSRPETLKDSLLYFKEVVNMTAPYLLLGAAGDYVFRKYIFYSVMNSIMSGPIGMLIPKIFIGYDITTQVFLLAMSILSILMSIRNISAWLLLFKFKGTFILYLYYLSWIALLAVINYWI